MRINIILFLLILSSCSINSSNKLIKKDFDFEKITTVENYKDMLEIYSKNSNFPKINDK